MSLVFDERHAIERSLDDTTMDKEIRTALLLALKDAEKTRQDGRLSGSYAAGPLADKLQQQVSAYVDGWKRAIPSWLVPYIEQARSEKDSEYEEYKRLHKKFNGIEPREEKNYSSMFPTKGKGNEDIMKDFV